MNNLLFLLLICFLFSSCAKTNDEPFSDYRFEVFCDNCVISIKNDPDTQTYNVSGYRSIPIDFKPPFINVSLNTIKHTDHTTIKFIGGGYDRIIFSHDLYRAEGTLYIKFNL